MFIFCDIESKFCLEKKCMMKNKMKELPIFTKQHSSLNKILNMAVKNFTSIKQIK